MIDQQKKIWPKVTVIIVNWNGERFLGACLSALQAQTLAPYEIIVVDNASSDASLDIVRRFPSVKLISQRENLGFARGNNLAIGMASAESDWIALLNPDAFPEPRWLEALLSAALSNPSVDVYGSKLISADDPEIIDGTGDVYHISGLVWRGGHGAVVTSRPDDMRDIFSPCAAAAMYRRSALRAVGGFDEDYFCYVEDVDLGFRLRLAGHHCLYVPFSVVRHVGSGTTGGQHSDFSVYHGHRNLVWAFIKNMPGMLFWLLLPFHIMLNIATVGYFILRGQGRVIIRAKYDAIKGISRMLKKRQLIQQNRKASISEIWRVLDKRLLPFRH